MMQRHGGSLVEIAVAAGPPAATILRLTAAFASGPAMQNSSVHSSGADRRIGLVVLTGFLGSGKTPPLPRLVNDPASAAPAPTVPHFAPPTGPPPPRHTQP